VWTSSAGACRLSSPHELPPSSQQTRSRVLSKGCLVARMLPSGRETSWKLKVITEDASNQSCCRRDMTAFFISGQAIRLDNQLFGPSARCNGWTARIPRSSGLRQKWLASTILVGVRMLRNIVERCRDSASLRCLQMSDYPGCNVNGRTYFRPGLAAAETPRCGSLRHHHHCPINIVSNGSAGWLI
jgi:hypothetical protein